MKLLRVKIQDGENTYEEYYEISNNEKPKKEDYADGFLRAVKEFEIFDISKEEYKVLLKFGVI